MSLENPGRISRWQNARLERRLAKDAEDKMRALALGPMEDIVDYIMRLPPDASEETAIPFEAGVNQLPDDEDVRVSSIDLDVRALDPRRIIIQGDE